MLKIKLFKNDDVTINMRFLSPRVGSFGVIWIRVIDPRSVWIMVHQMNQ